VQLKQLALKGLLIQRHCFNTQEFSDVRAARCGWPRQPAALPVNRIDAVNRRFAPVAQTTVNQRLRIMITCGGNQGCLKSNMLCAVVHGGNLYEPTEINTPQQDELNQNPVLSTQHCIADSSLLLHAGCLHVLHQHLRKLPYMQCSARAQLYFPTWERLKR
jgi:hypothetical protein